MSLIRVELIQNTNVVELNSRLEKNENQLTFYNSGIGTYATPSWRSPSYWMSVFENTLDLALALYVIISFLHTVSLALTSTLGVLKEFY